MHCHPQGNDFAYPADSVRCPAFSGGYGVRADFREHKKREALQLLYMESGSDLSSRAVSSQVLSAQESLTTVFGMGTGGTSPSLSPVILRVRGKLVSSSQAFVPLLPLPSVRCFRFPFAYPDNCTSSDSNFRPQLISSFLSCSLLGLRFRSSSFTSFRSSSA